MSEMLFAHVRLRVGRFGGTASDRAVLARGAYGTSPSSAQITGWLGSVNGCVAFRCGGQSTATQAELSIGKLAGDIRVIGHSHRCSLPQPFLTLPPVTSLEPSRTDVIRISALGGLSVRDSDGKPVAGAAAQPRRMAILALLARAGQRGITREKLLALLWPDADDERGPRTLAQALYALRKDLGAEDAISGSKELSFDPALVSSDVSEFASAVARGDDERAVSLYQGPFLDGFHLSGANEFSRWVETERTSLAQEHSRALESLARSARAAGDTRASLGWWRKLAGLEPLNARVTVGLMEALAAAGDRAGAIQHARVYELLVEQELDLPPDRDVLSLAEQLRRTADEPAPVAASVSPSLSAVAVADVATPVRRSSTGPSVDAPLNAPTPPAHVGPRPRSQQARLTRKTFAASRSEDWL